RIRRTGRGLSRIPPAQPVDIIHLLGARVVRLQVLVGDRPGRRNAVMMVQLTEILASQPIERSAEQFGRAADEVVHLWLKWPAVTVMPGIGGYVPVLLEYRRRIPVLHLALEPVAALEDQDALSRRRELPGESATARAAADDDDVVSLDHGDPLKADAGLHDSAVREDGCRSEIACAIAGEEPDHAGDLLRARHAP